MRASCAGSLPKNGADGRRISDQGATGIVGISDVDRAGGTRWVAIRARRSDLTSASSSLDFWVEQQNPHTSEQRRTLQVLTSTAERRRAPTRAV